MDLQVIQGKIYEIRGFRVMLDYDLAELYQVETKHLKQSVRRNPKRFPPDFMFELTKDEYNFLRSQIVTLEIESGGRGKYSKYLPYAFTEFGVSMLSSVLNSEKAIEINIGIMRAFALLRELTIGYTELKRQLEQFQLDTTLQITEIFDIINALAEKQKTKDKPRKQIGFRKDNNNDNDNDNNNDPIQ